VLGVKAHEMHILVCSISRFFTRYFVYKPRSPAGPFCIPKGPPCLSNHRASRISMRFEIVISLLGENPGKYETLIRLSKLSLQHAVTSSAPTQLSRHTG
jgi:hypothetical protein